MISLKSGDIIHSCYITHAYDVKSGYYRCFFDVGSLFVVLSARSEFDYVMIISLTSRDIYELTLEFPNIIKC